jgi:hypothetical protein
MKQKLIVVMTVVVLVLAACGSSEGILPTLESSPSPVATKGDACPTPTAGTTLLTNTEDGYCLLYPAEYSTSMSNFIVINPVSGPGDMPGDAWVYIQVDAAAGRTAAQVVDEEIAVLGPGFNTSRIERMVAGEQAIVVDGLPGQDSARDVFIVHNDRLYSFYFMPWYPNTTDPTPLENLYTMVMDTLHFMP